MIKGKIRRALLPFEDQYVQVPNDWARDERLTYRARGILLTLLSHKQGYDLALTDLVVGTERQEAVRTAVRELETFGYLARVYPPNAGRFAAPDWVLQMPPTVGDERPRPVEN